MIETPLTLTIAPYICKILHGEKVDELSFIQHPPAQWSWNLARAMSYVLLDDSLKQYTQNQRGLTQKEVLAHLGETWIKKSKVNFRNHPYIMAHTTALLEYLVMRSNDALRRIYGEHGAELTHIVLIAMHTQGRKNYTKWHEEYYNMRQSIETNNTIQSYLTDHVRHYPYGWDETKERNYIRDSETHKRWPLFENHDTWLRDTLWFDPTSMATHSAKLCFKSHAVDAYRIDKIKEQPHEAVCLSKEVSVDLILPHNVTNSIFITELIEFGFTPIAGVRPMHISIKLAHTNNLNENLALQQTHAIACSNYISETLEEWLKYPLVREKTQNIPFQPSLTIKCEIKNPTSNALWSDVLNEQLTQSISDIFRINNMTTMYNT